MFFSSLKIRNWRILFQAGGSITFKTSAFKTSKVLIRKTGKNLLIFQ